MIPILIYVYTSLLSLFIFLQFFSQQTSNIYTLAAVESQYRNAQHICACYALFEYLNQGLDEACKVFDRTLDEYVARGVERSIDAEILFMAYPLVNIDII